MVLVLLEASVCRLVQLGGGGAVSIRRILRHTRCRCKIIELPPSVLLVYIITDHAIPTDLYVFRLANTSCTTSYLFEVLLPLPRSYFRAHIYFSSQVQNKTLCSSDCLSLPPCNPN
ncbi:uncharacterized protein C8R40DRAFT_509281 [Lentinula edodes]|uniref:uncharacterized protein n=1 Tax=Lentinula edodes TaxID=5353 RepID=UPI001E8CB057|nr:uncharacterized protein C8R40DRAFT_509281 [Lentinula edodes]KAH7872210.1 hypothetical protein C8R40DRAFT_509281 [Lentinula edodes]